MSSTGARPNRRLEQGEQSRQEILDAAARLMAANGFDGASISSIAKESGLPASSIYWHFSSKEGVLAAVMERGAQRFFASVDQPGVPEDAPPVEHLRGEFRLASAAIRRDPGFLRLFMLLLLSGRSDESLRRVRREGRQRLHDAVYRAYRRSGAAAGAWVAGELADTALAMFDGAFLAVQNDPGLDYEPLLMQMAEAICALGDKMLAGRPRPQDARPGS